MDENKKYHATIDIDDDRWAKHPFGYTIYDEDNNQVYMMNFLDDWDACYKGIARWNVDKKDIETKYY